MVRSGLVWSMSVRGEGVVGIRGEKTRRSRAHVAPNQAHHTHATTHTRHHIPRCTPRHHTPRCMPRNHTPRCTPRHHTPRCTPRNHTPCCTPRHHTPRCTPRNHTSQHTPPHPHCTPASWLACWLDFSLFTLHTSPSRTHEGPGYSHLMLVSRSPPPPLACCFLLRTPSPLLLSPFRACCCFW